MQRPGKRKEQEQTTAFLPEKQHAPHDDSIDLLPMLPCRLLPPAPGGSIVFTPTLPAYLLLLLLIRLALLAVAVSVTTQQKNFKLCTGDNLSPAPLFCRVSLELEALPSAGMARTAFSVSEDAPTTAPSNQWCLKKAMRTIS